MITENDNARLTSVLPGTPGGELLRRYWYPIATAGEMREPWTKRVRLLGEDLALYRDRGGHLSVGGYAVGELGGLIWAYLGPQPAPVIPPIDGFVVDGAIRMLGHALVPCNWLQIMENSCDPVHTEWLHGHLHEFVEEQRDGVKPSFAISRHHVAIAFEEFELGLYKRRLYEGQSEDADDWRVGHPVLFPNTLASGSKRDGWRTYQFQIRVPVDDTSTMHYWYHVYSVPGVEIPEHMLADVVTYEVPFRNERGEFALDMLDAQDVMAWVTQGPIAKRELEKLGTTDRGVILFRKMLEREIDNVAAGRDPMGVIRDANRGRIDLPVEYAKGMMSDGMASRLPRGQSRHYPYREDLMRVLAQAGESLVATR